MTPAWSDGDAMSIERAAEAIRSADAIVVGAGAGMGVDSGLPDFRGDKGFWRAYPPFQELGLRFVDLANPAWFDRDPALAWGFYGHRLALYRETTPHAGFELLRRWAAAAPRGGFVFTSNVDGQFQCAGFEEQQIVEVHGSLMHLQCSRPCHDGIWNAQGVSVAVDESTFRAMDDLPRCPDCDAVARPNVLMFGDARWVADRTEEQHRRYETWLATRRDARLVVIEAGAGTAVPTVRMHSERLSRGLGATLVRINPREPQGPAGTLSIARGAAEVIAELDELV